jgi:hypothetical protein
MNIKKIQFLVAVALVGSIGLANAQTPFTGTLDANDQSPETGSFTSTSISLDPSNLVSLLPSGESGTFTATVPPGSELSADTVDITGLSSTPVSEDIDGLLTFASQGPIPSGTGTTPVNRFSFDLTSLSEDYVSSSVAFFTGYGTLLDDQGAYSETPAELLVTFSGPDTYSLTLQAVPEPTTISLVLAGLGVLPFLRRKR